MTSALQAAAGADFTFAYVFGERVSHLNLNLAPHLGDALVDTRGLIRAGAVTLPTARHQEVAANVRDILRLNP